MIQRRWAIAAACVIWSAGVATAEDKPTISLRGMMRIGIDAQGQVHGDLKNITKWANATAIHYKIVLVDPQTGMEKEVPEDFVFRVGQMVRLKIETASDLYVYVFHEGPDGSQQILLPDHLDKDGPPKAKKGTVTTLPSDGTSFMCTDPPGKEKLIVLAAPQPQPRLTPKEVFQSIDANTRESKQIRIEREEVFNNASNRKGEVRDVKDPQAALADAGKLQVTRRGMNATFRNRLNANNGEKGTTLVVGSSRADEKPSLYAEILLQTEKK